jgi:CRP-like cAMP-binding protein
MDISLFLTNLLFMGYDETYELVCESCTIRTHPLFRHLHPEELEEISLNKIAETYQRGDIIYHEGNRMKGFYCVQKGIIKIYKTGSDGKEQIVRFAKPGDVIGYRSVVSNEPACTTTEVLEESVHFATYRLKFYSSSYRAMEFCG